MFEDSKKPKAYIGNQSFVFVSYSHVDSDVVYSIIRHLQTENVRVWYDDGIECGSEFPESLENKIEESTVFVLFVSPHSVESRTCRKELTLALDVNPDRILVVYLESTELKYGLKLQLSNIQYLMYDSNELDFFSKFLSTLRKYSADIFSSEYVSIYKDPSRIISFDNTITELKKNALKDAGYVEEIILPDGLCSIGKAAFSGCVSLNSINIPETIERIEEKTFEKCSSLEKIYLPDTISYIGDRAFFQCTELKAIHIPNKLETIGCLTFSECESLTNVELGESIVDIGEGAFLNCTKLENVMLNARITMLREKTFQGCVLLKDMTFQKPLKRIEKSAFQECSSLQTVILPDTLESIGERAFSGCASLYEIVLPERLREIGNWAFFDCSSLVKINIPDSLRCIRSETFINCTSLRLVSISSNCAVEGNPFPEGCQVVRRKKLSGQEKSKTTRLWR